MRKGYRFCLFLRFIAVGFLNCFERVVFVLFLIVLLLNPVQGRIQGGDAPGARPPLKLEKIRFFWRKIVIFHTKYPKNFAPPSARRNFFKCAPLT